MNLYVCVCDETKSKTNSNACLFAIIEVKYTFLFSKIKNKMSRNSLIRHYNTTI
jgi:hypothetical protein